MTARIGLIIPSSNRMVEGEMVRHLPPGYVAHVARLRMTGAHRVAIEGLVPRLMKAAAMLTDARCDVIGFHCTANSTSEGAAGEAKLIAALRQAGARLVTTTATAIRHALETLRARRIVLLTPYSEQVTDEEAEFLHMAGFQVLYARGFALKRQRRVLRDAAAVLARPRHRGGAAGGRRLFPELRQYFGIPGDRGDRAETRPPGGDQQPGRGLGSAVIARSHRSAQLSRPAVRQPRLGPHR